MRSERKSDSPGRLRPPPNYFSRKEQYRLLLLVSTLMLVLALMNEARKPSTWAWMWSEQPLAQEESVDTRLTGSQRRELPPDAFVAAPPVTRPPAANVSTDPSLPPLFPGVTPPLLSRLEDDTVMRAAETEVWLAIFGQLQQLSEDEIEAMPATRAGFIQLFRQTDVYRGRLVTVAGIARRVDEIQARDNPLGIQRYFRWILDQRGAANAPIILYSLDKPEAFGLGDNLRDFVTFKAVCYKRWAYLAGDGTRVAPLLLAKTAIWDAPVAAPASWLPSMPIMMATILGLAILAGLVAMAVYHRSNHLTPQVARVRSRQQLSLPALEEAEVLPSVGESLQELSERASRIEEQP